MASATFSDKSYGGLSFSGVTINETGVGTTGTMVGTPGLDYRATDVPGAAPPGLPNPYQGLSWAGFGADALTPGSSLSVTISFTVQELTSGKGISGLQQALTPHYPAAAGVSLSAVEYVYSDAAKTQLVAQSTIDLSHTSATAPVAPGDFGLSAAFQTLYVSVEVNATVAADAPSGSKIGFSIIDQGFHQTSLANQAALGDTVWDDANKDGIQNNGETGVAGVTVKLLDGTGHFTGLTTTTDANGNYAFTNLNVGVYEVQFVPPVDYTFTLPGQGGAGVDSNADQSSGITGPITLVAGQNDITIDAGLVAPPGSHDSATAALGNFVWEDANANGIQDSGETGISGLTVTLLNAGGGVITSTTTGTDGGYSFTNLTAGVYEVQFATAAGYSFTQTGQGDTATDSNADTGTGLTALITLAAGQVDDTIDAGMYRPASIGDYVWNDCNWNGIQDGCETGIGGVTVKLIGANGSVVSTTTTDASGHYGFNNLTVGTYSVQFVAPAGSTFSSALQGSSVALDSNVISVVGSTGSTGAFSVAAGETITTIDAGLHTDVGLHETSLFKTISGPLSAADVASLNDCGATYGPPSPAHFTEPGPITVNSGTATPLYTGPSAGRVNTLLFVLSATPVIDPSALITFSYGSTTVVFHAVDFASSYDDGFPNRIGGIANGAVNGIKFTDSLHAAVQVTFAAPLNSFGGTDTTIGNVRVNSSVDLRVDVFGVSNGHIVNNAANSGAIGVTGDSGFGDCCSGGGGSATASLGDLVFEDCNGNGIQDAGEAGIGCVTVKLLNSSGSVLSTTTTDSNGRYLFSNLAAGTYKVQFVTPNGYSLTSALQGSNTALDSNPNQSTGVTNTITLAAGQTDLSIDAGMYKPASLGDLVFCDSNGNGVRDWCESGVSGVTVKLLSGDGSQVLATTTTDRYGQYSFNNLKPGVYEVQFVAPSGKAFTIANAGYNDSIDSDANANGITGPITLSCGTCDKTVDAGLITAPTRGSIGDFVFNDKNHNGVQDSGESGISGVTVKLLNSSGSVLNTTTTNSSGKYLFGNLAAGSYIVQFVKPTGYTVSTALRGNNTALDSDANTSTGKTAVITLSAGQNNVTIDAGMYQTQSGGGGGCGGWTYNDDRGCSGGTSGGWGGSCWGGSNYNNWCSGGDNYGGYGGCGGGSYGGYGGYGGGSYGGYGGNCYGGGSYGGGSGGGLSGATWCASDQHSGGQYSGGGDWGSCGWTGWSWTGGANNSNCGPGELQSLCGNVKQVEFTYHHSDFVSSDAFSCGVGSSSGHNGGSSCFIQITDKSGDHSWGSKVYCQGTLNDGDKIETNSAFDLTSCGGQLYAHIYNSQADYNAGRSSIQQISFNCSGSRDLYLGQQVGSLCLTGYDGSHGSASTNW